MTIYIYMYLYMYMIWSVGRCGGLRFSVKLVFSCNKKQSFSFRAKHCHVPLFSCFSKNKLALDLTNRPTAHKLC